MASRIFARLRGRSTLQVPSAFGRFPPNDKEYARAKYIRSAQVQQDRASACRDWRKPSSLQRRSTTRTMLERDVRQLSLLSPRKSSGR